MKAIQKMFNYTYSDRESFFEDFDKALKKERYKLVDEKWDGNKGYFKIANRNGEIADIVTENYTPRDIILAFPIKAKDLNKIIEKYFIYDKENNIYYDKKYKNEVGDYKELLNYIGDYGCIAYDEELLIMANDEVDNDPFDEVDYYDKFSEVELVNLYESYCEL